MSFNDELLATFTLYVASLKNNLCFLLIGIILIFMQFKVYSAPLTQAQQQSMYRYCKSEFSNYSGWYSTKMCNCLVQSYQKNIPMPGAAEVCVRQALDPR